MKAVIATHNRKKAAEMVKILGSALPNWEFRTLADFPGAPEPEETGTTYEANALIKSRSSFKETGWVSIADDAGLEIDAFDGAPGVYSKRFRGESTNFEDKMDYILSEIKTLPDSKRGARFNCFVAITYPSGMKSQDIVFSATCEGRIAPEKSGAGGFGYDPIFWLPELGCTMADLTAEQKHAISHRGKVLAQVIRWLKENLDSPVLD